MKQTGKITYRYSGHRNGNGSRDVLLSLSLVSDGDEGILHSGGIRHLRLRRIIRLTTEAAEYGVLLGYEDLSLLLLTSLATLKRDIASLEAKGLEVSLRGRRKKRSGHISNPQKFIPQKNDGRFLPSGDGRPFFQREGTV
ncbi:MAG: hypothetical protein C0402_11195 [Thermodesulfovibrio sp.]|nr:hypothetical protein [Thermodesulfovibrio sp.]